MIDLTASSLPPAAAPTPVATAAGAAAPPGAFGQTLAAFLDAHDATTDVPGTAGRQEAAGDGKDSPSATDSDPDNDPAATVPLWLPTALLPLPLAASSPDAAPDTGASAAIAAATPPTLASHPVLPLASADQAAIIPLPTHGVARPATTQTAVLTAAVAPETPATPPPPVPQTVAAVIADALDRAEHAPLQASAPSRAALGDTVASVSVPSATASQQIAVSATPQPAGQVFAAAIAAASSWRDRDAQTKQDSTDTAAPIGIAAPLLLAERAVHAAGDATGTALDLTQDIGLHRMIDHIETLRDAASDRADARDTRIRLIPDALGSVDVAVRRDGDRVHVSFAADQAATRALLADASPRLTELAAARGVRIGDTSVATDAGNGGANQQARPAPMISRAPTPAAIATETPSDARVA